MRMKALTLTLTLTLTLQSFKEDRDKSALGFAKVWVRVRAVVMLGANVCSSDIYVNIYVAYVCRAYTGISMSIYLMRMCVGSTWSYPS